MRLQLGIDSFDLVLVKEAVHHFTDPSGTLLKLSSLVRPGGSLLVVMLPKRIEYPLFDAALQYFIEVQPDPANIERHLASAGLTVTRELRGFELTLPKQRWLTMVSNRFMSLLSSFDDDALALGVSEIQDKHSGVEELRFMDTFEFVLGRRPE